MSHVKYPSICIYISLCVQMDTQTISNTHTQIRLLHFKDLQHLKTRNSILSQSLDILNPRSYFLAEAQKVVADRKNSLSAAN